MNEPLNFAAVAKSVWQDFARARRALVICDILYKLFEAWLLVPAIALLLAVVLAKSGHVAVSNLDILTFLLTPFGLVYAALLTTTAVALLLFEQAGVMVIAVLAGAAKRPTTKETIDAVLQKTWRVAQLGAIQAGLLALTFLPFLLLALLTYW